MKKKITAVFAVVCSIVYGQSHIGYGIKGGLNVTNLRGDYPKISVEGAEFSNNIEVNSKLGFAFGGFLEYSLSEKFNWQVDVWVSKQGNKIEITNTEFPSESLKQETTLHYINLPFTAKYQISENLKLELGAYIGYAIKAINKMSYRDTEFQEDNEAITINLLKKGTYYFLGEQLTVKSTINQLDYGLVAGASYSFSEAIFAEVRYNYGLAVVDKNSTIGTNTNSWNLKNGVVQFSIGCKF